MTFWKKRKNVFFAYITSCMYDILCSSKKRRGNVTRFPTTFRASLHVKISSNVSPYPELISIRNLGATDLYIHATHSQAHTLPYIRGCISRTSSDVFRTELADGPGEVSPYEKNPDGLLITNTFQRQTPSIYVHLSTLARIGNQFPEKSSSRRYLYTYIYIYIDSNFKPTSKKKIKK